MIRDSRGRIAAAREVSDALERTLATIDRVLDEGDAEQVLDLLSDARALRALAKAGRGALHCDACGEPVAYLASDEGQGACKCDGCEECGRGRCVCDVRQERAGVEGLHLGRLGVALRSL